VATGSQSAGARIVLLMSIAAIASTAAALLLEGLGEAGIRSAVRTSARVAAVFFLLPFSASALWTSWRRPLFRSMLRYRRHLGLGFAVTHFVHAATFLTLAARHTESFLANTSVSTLIGGSVGYVLLIAMTATSFDRPAAWLGRRAWKALHKTGSYVLWAIFFASYAGMAGRRPGIWLLLAGLGGAYALRVWAWARTRRTRASRATERP